VQIKITAGILTEKLALKIPRPENRRESIELEHKQPII